jgi:XTP/dITP diphosphohydrolase
MKLLIATHNSGKLHEIKEMLLGLGAELVSLEELGISQDYPEDGHTFEANALGKARFYHELSGLPTVADDSGIFIEALASELGVKTRRWGAGEKVSDEEWLVFFMKRMATEENRKAKFVCVAAYVDDVQEVAFEGETVGVVTDAVQVPVKSGIPLSSVFLPEGYARVFAELSTDEKNHLSHRGKAFSKLLHFLTHA